MVTMTAVYKNPLDLEFFEKHYFEIHIPLAKQLPGLLRYEINDGPIRSTTGHSDTYRIANLYFESMDILIDAFQSEIGKQCAADRRILAGNDEVQIYLYESKEV